MRQVPAAAAPTEARHLAMEAEIEAVATSSWEEEEVEVCPQGPVPSIALTRLRAAPLAVQHYH